MVVTDEGRIMEVRAVHPPKAPSTDVEEPAVMVLRFVKYCNSSKDVIEVLPLKT
mgnify:CR=1 FL=1